MRPSVSRSHQNINYDWPETSWDMGDHTWVTISSYKAAVGIMTKCWHTCGRNAFKCWHTNDPNCQNYLYLVSLHLALISESSIIKKGCTEWRIESCANVEIWWMRGCTFDCWYCDDVRVGRLLSQHHLCHYCHHLCHHCHHPHDQLPPPQIIFVRKEISFLMMSFQLYRGCILHNRSP